VAEKKESVIHSYFIFEDKFPIKQKDHEYCSKWGRHPLGERLMRKKMRAVCSWGLVVLFAISQSGCSVFAPPTQSLMITASEKDAEIFVNGHFEGTGEVKTRVARNENVAIMAKKKGFFPATRTIPTEMSTAGILDVIGGCIFIIPFIGLFYAGAHQLQISKVSMIMAER